MKLNKYEIAHAYCANEFYYDNIGCQLAGCPTCGGPKDVPVFDKSDYARSLGYTGGKSVIIQDGRVISHRCVAWHQFCRECREGKR